MNAPIEDRTVFSALPVNADAYDAGPAHGNGYVAWVHADANDCAVPLVSGNACANDGHHHENGHVHA